MLCVMLRCAVLFVLCWAMLLVFFHFVFFCVVWLCLSRLAVLCNLV